MPTRRAALSLLLATPALAAAPPTPPLREDWHDPARGRTLPMLLRLPVGEAPAPLVLVSHGLGGSREGLAYLGEALAGAGFAALHVQHPGTDESLLRGPLDRRLAFAAAATDAGRALDRLRDTAFVLDEIVRRPALAARIDGTRIGIAGHSYGAWLVQHMLGQRLPGGDRGLTLPDPRLSAGIALSPMPPEGLPPRLAFARVAVPVLHVTGTLDHGWIGGTDAAARRVPYDAITAPGVLAGAAHTSFAGEPGVGARWEDATYHPRTAGLAVAFLRAVWRREASARDFLQAGAPGLLAEADRLESKGLGSLG